MINLEKYLKRIKFEGKPKADLVTPRKLHLHHMLKVPFENLDIHLGRKIILEPEVLYNKIVLNNRGGFCYEMNGLFYEIITLLGFKAKRVSARVFNDNGEPGREFDHMAVIVDLDGVEWLADVGFGDSFLEPLKFVPDLEQAQYGKLFKIVKVDEENFKTVCSEDGKEYKDMYLFSHKPRELAEYNEMCVYQQESPDSHFVKNTICTLARTGGRITLSGLKLTELKDGVKTETALQNTEEFNIKLKELFGIIL
jgi:N-hydroxyarylamine O-acetyltransferase